jgi:hypothetical protein
LKRLLKEHHWTLNAWTSGKQQVFSAKQRQGKRLDTLYIGTENRLEQLTTDDIVAKINRRAAERLAHSDKTNDQARTDQRQPLDRAMPALSIIPLAIRTEANSSERIHNAAH